MARIQYRMDKKSNGQHTGKSQTETTGSGSFLATWDTADITTIDQLRAAFEAFVLTVRSRGDLS